jgi:hypothetical protein
MMPHHDMSNNNLDNDDNNEEYNQYVLSDGIWAKIDAQTNASILDMIYTRARKKIRERSGLLSTPAAVELVLKEDRDEMLNDIVESLRKEGFPLTAESFKNENTRDDALRALRLMITELEDPN